MSAEKGFREVTLVWISNQDSIGRKNVQYGWKRQRRRRLLNSWVNVSMTRTSRILPNKTRINCWLATIRFCMESKQPRRAIKTYRGGILLCDQSLTGNDLKGIALSRNLGNYFDWLTFVVTQIIRTSQVRTLLRNSLLQNFHHRQKFGRSSHRHSGYPLLGDFVWLLKFCQQDYASELCRV